ncbi:hypothetical protein M0802_013028 [Mischocyttarus mexicanus]|nr:hypothetical protein M0802_013028 [Mischocyttarus mexicanus]
MDLDLRDKAEMQSHISLAISLADAKACYYPGSIRRDAKACYDSASMRRRTKFETAMDFDLSYKLEKRSRFSYSMSLAGAIAYSD